MKLISADLEYLYNIPGKFAENCHIISNVFGNLRKFNFKKNCVIYV